MSKIKKSLFSTILIVVLFYISSLAYSFTNIYLSFKQDDSYKLKSFIDKKKLSSNFENQLNSIIFEKIEKDTFLKIIYSIDKIKFDALINNNIKKLAFHLSEEKTLLSLYQNPISFKNQIDNLKLDKIQQWDNKQSSENSVSNLEKKKFNLVGPNVKELHKDTNYFFLTSINTFKLDFLHKGINIIVKLKLDKLIWKISYIEIKF